MIQMPHRSVTRFFIPLIDVLFLMFSMFLLLPFMQPGAKAGKDLKQYSRDELEALSQNLQKQLTDTQQVLAANKRAREQMEKQVQELRQEVQRLEPYADTRIELSVLTEQVQKLRKEKMETLQQRLFIRLLEIDPKTGKLLYYEPGQPPKVHRIESEQQARALIHKDKERPEARGREIYYLFVFPRVDSPYPEQRQFTQYQRWFSDVPHGMDLSLRSLTP